MTLAHWDTHTAPTLHLIEDLSKQVGSRAKQIQSAVRDLPAHPGFVSKAEAELEDAKRDLMDALKIVTRAQEAYARLPADYRRGD